MGSQYRNNSSERVPERTSEDRGNAYPKISKNVTSISPIDSSSQSRTQTLQNHAHKSDSEIPSFRGTNNNGSRQNTLTSDRQAITLTNQNQNYMIIGQGNQVIED